MRPQPNTKNREKGENRKAGRSAKEVGLRTEDKKKQEGSHVELGPCETQKIKKET